MNELALALMLSWTPPTEREDNTQLPASEIQGYKLYINDQPTFTIPGDRTSWDMTGVSNGVRLKLTTIDTDGRESVLSNEVTVNLLPDPPVLECTQ